MCAFAELEQKPMSELLALLDGSTWGIDCNGEETMRVQKDKELREATGGCPACILAALRQNKLPEVDISIDWKMESLKWLETYRKQSAYGYV